MAQAYRGNDKLIFGIVLAVITFWLFAQTTDNVKIRLAAAVALQFNVLIVVIGISESS